MDFYEIKESIINKQIPERKRIYPEFNYDGKDIACKGNLFYAFWDGHIWNTNREDLVRIIDHDIWQKAEELKKAGGIPVVELLNQHSSGQMTTMIQYFKQKNPDEIGFNEKIVFEGEEPCREDYATHILPYYPTEGSTENFDELFGILYASEELQKIMWFIGALLSGEMRNIQKFLFLYGGKGTGKGTIIKVMKDIFEGYYSSISLKNLTGSSEFATSEIKEVPLLLDEDCDISSIKDDTNLLKMTAHEPVMINKKHMSTYLSTFTGLLVAASNERFKVKHVDSGITRRAVVAEPSKKTVRREEYEKLMTGIQFEISHIAWKAMQVYSEMGRAYYDDYVDVKTMEETDYMYAFVEEYRDRLGDPVSLASASALYKEYLENMGFNTDGYKRVLKKGLSRYYDDLLEYKKIDGVSIRNVFSGFKADRFKSRVGVILDPTDGWIAFDEHNVSELDELLVKQPAQYANEEGTPTCSWDTCKTELWNLDAHKLHYVRVPENHIVIDFDLKDPDSGEKSLDLNLAAANAFPRTYAEVSKSGQGIHLHYIYNGDVSKLSSLYDYNIEVKTFPGKSSLRRMLTKCNDEKIATISSGLPLKEESSRMYDNVSEIVWTEKKMRTAIERNMRKEYHANTKPSMDFIFKIFKDAEAAGLKYDLRDLRQAVHAFAATSTNQSKACLDIFRKIPWSTIPEEKEKPMNAPEAEGSQVIPNEKLWFWDIESYSNVFIVCGKRWHSNERVRFINPSREEIESLVHKPLVGFNNLKYDNHMTYYALMGASPYELYLNSQKLISNEQGAGTHSGAYGLAYLDVYEMSTKKQSLKKWEAELGIKHDEMDWPWDKPLPEDKWERAADYCMNDVDATEAVFDHLETDYEARCILSSISGLPVGSKTQNQTARILFGNDRRPQDKFPNIDLSKEFPGYKFDGYKATYKGEDPSRGGYVYSEPGIYDDVVLLDAESLHPSTMEIINYFGPYTQNFADLKAARIAVKHHDFDKAGKMFGGALKPYLNDETAKSLAYALKIAINIVYGMTSASYDNVFKSPYNKDNVVAKRGALFMIDLKEAVENEGYQVVHVKTDSIKVPNGDDYIINFVQEFGKKYGYSMAHEATYKRMALVNKAVYIAELGWNEDDIPEGTWTATGAQFAEPYVFKKLFSHENLVDEDFFLTKTVKSEIHIGEQFVGKVAKVYASVTGEELTRVDNSEEPPKVSYVTGTKGYKWRLAEDFRGNKDIDIAYYDGLVRSALEAIAKVGPIGSIVDEVPDQYNDLLLPF